MQRLGNAEINTHRYLFRTCSINHSVFLLNGNGSGEKMMPARPTNEGSESSLQAAEICIRGILALSPLPMALIRLQDGVHLLANDAFSQLSGYRSKEIEGSTADEINLDVDPHDRRRLTELLRKKSPVTGVDIRLRRKDATILNCRLSAGIVPFMGQNCMLAVTTFSAALQPAQSALHPVGDRFAAILENISEGYYEVDLTGNFTFFNNAIVHIIGYSHEELTGMNYRVYAVPEYAETVKKVFNEVYSTGRPGKLIDCAIIRKDGTLAWVETSASLLSDASGQSIGFYGILRDRTNQKLAEEALRRSEESYRRLLELAPNSITITRIADGRFMQVNNAFCKRTGYRAEEVIGRTVSELNIYADPTDRERLYDALHRHGRVEGMEIRYRSKTGETLDNIVSAQLIEFRNEDCLLNITMNIGPLKEAQSALQRSEEKYRQILETMDEGYYEIDFKGNSTYYNESTRRLHGYSTEEMKGINYRQYLHPEEAEAHRKAFKELYRTGRPVKLSNYEIIRKDGSVRYVESSSYPLKDHEGKIIGFWGISRDRTEQKRAEIALHKSEEQYRLLVDNANDGIYITQDGRVKFFNPKTVAITGYSERELADMAFDDLVHPEDRSMYDRHRGKLEEQHAPTVFSFRILDKEGETLWVELSAIGITWEGRAATLNFLRNVTLQKKMEALLLQSRKMEAVGTLAGGIAHDFNNLLMGIQGNASLALMEMGEKHPLHDKLKNIEQYVKAGASLTKQLLGTARGGKYEVRPTYLNSVVEASADMFGRTRKEICIHKKFDEVLWTVEVDRGQIEQVLLNLYVNAWHAMPDGGDLYLETSNVCLDEFYVRPYGVPPGRFVKFSVTDTGAGIDPKDLKRVFDPFFTTKGMSRGTGLGLASAYGIISNHGGIIAVYSEKGEGTTFNIYLPASDKRVADSGEPQKETRAGRETILFVDDEKGILEVGRLILQKLGYTVVTAKSGAEAAALYTRRKHHIDLVLLDMVMPGMGGSETFDALKAINPDVKIVLCSGYSINGQARRILDRGCKGFIQKPFSMQDLSARLRQVLDE
jgi:two-component system, cell cycle sensor histidine kinase and response regulator CckA